MEYTVRIVEFPTSTDYQHGIIDVFRDESGVDLAIRFISPKGNKIYIPFGSWNKEPGSSTRQLHWIKKDEVLSITRSIQYGTDEHFYLTENKTK